MLLSASEIDGLTQFRQFRQRREVGEYGTLHVRRLCMRDVREQRHLPVHVSRLLRSMSHPEASARVVSPYRLRKTPVTHERTEDNLHLHCAEETRLGKHDAVTDRDLPRFPPPPGSTYEVVVSQVHDSTAVPRAAPGALNDEVQELFGPAIVEPVDDLPRNYLSQFGVVGEHLDRHLLVDDFPDSLPRAIGQSDLGIPGSAAKHDA